MFSNQAQQLIESIAQFKSVVIAFSGGVDSSVVAAAAYHAQKINGLGKAQSTLAVTALSPSIASWQIELASRVAQQIGIDHEWVHTNELTILGYQSNGPDRCFFCKQTLYTHLRLIAAQYADCVILSGTNFDDLGDYRPGLLAGAQAKVQTPLADLNLGKSVVRRLAKEFGLASADTPASPCLSSRIAYGTPVTAERLQKIDRAESTLRQHGFDICRVRVTHSPQGDVASIEVPIAQIEDLRKLLTGELKQQFTASDWVAVEVQAAGFRSGRMNDAIVSEQLVVISQRRATTS